MRWRWPGAGEARCCGELVLQHEHQHNETMLQTLQLAEPAVLFAPERRRPRRAAAAAGWSACPPGRSDGQARPPSFAYDNERPAHEVDLAAFEIDRRQ